MKAKWLGLGIVVSRPMTRGERGTLVVAITIIVVTLIFLLRLWPTGPQELPAAPPAPAPPVAVVGLSVPTGPTPAGPNLPPDFPTTQPLPEGWEWVRITYRGAGGDTYTLWAAAGEIMLIYAPFTGTTSVGFSAGLVTVYKPSEKTEAYRSSALAISALKQGLVLEGIPRERIPFKDGDRVTVQRGQVLVTLEKPVRIFVAFREGEKRDHTSFVPVSLDVLTTLLNGG
jgi:hypothetical protein